MFAERPQVSSAQRHDVRWVLFAWVIDAFAYCAAAGVDLADQRVDLVRREPDTLQRVPGAQLAQELRQRGRVPLRELMRAAVRDAERDRIQIRAGEANHRHLVDTELLRGLEARVAGDDLARQLHDERLQPAEAADRGRDVGDRVVVDAGIRGIGEVQRERNPLDGQGIFRGQGPCAKSEPTRVAEAPRPAGEAWRELAERRPLEWARCCFDDVANESLAPMALAKAARNRGVAVAREASAPTI